MNDEPQHKHRKYWLLCIFAVFIAILGIVLPEIDIGETVYINATTIDVSGFASYSGCTVANISEINNLNCSGVEAVGSPWLITVNFTNITHFDFLEVKHRYYSVVGKATDVNDIEIYCKTERSYISLFRFTDQVESTEFTRSIPDVEHFIDNGNVSIRLNHSETGNANDRYILDTVRLIEKPTFNQNLITQIFNTTTTGGGGVSFNGSAVDLMNSTLSNGTFTGIYNHSNGTNLDYDHSNHTGFAGITPKTTYYVNKTGSDSNNCITSPCLTIQKTISLLSNKPQLEGNVIINVGDGIYTENLVIPTLDYSAYSLTLQANLTLITSYVVDSIVTDSIYGIGVNNASMNTDYRYKLMMNSFGDYTPINFYNSTGKYLAYKSTNLGGEFRTPLAGSTVYIYDWNTTINGTNNIPAIELNPYSKIIIKNFTIQSYGSNSTQLKNTVNLLTNSEAYIKYNNITAPNSVYGAIGSDSTGFIWLEGNVLRADGIATGYIARLSLGSTIFTRFFPGNVYVGNVGTAILLTHGSNLWSFRDSFIGTNASGKPAISSQTGSFYTVSDVFVNWTNSNELKIASTTGGDTFVGTSSGSLYLNSTLGTTVQGLSGAGNAYPVRVNESGTLIVNRTAGAGITMKSPDGNSWCITVSNAGAMAVAAGACP